MFLNKFLSGIFVLIILISAISPVEPSNIFLEEGKNIVNFNNSDFFYVSSFARLNPDVEVVSFFDGSKTVGYVNFLGGIGEDFVMRSDMDYEVIMKKNATIILPY